MNALIMWAGWVAFFALAGAVTVVWAYFFFHTEEKERCGYCGREMNWPDPFWNGKPCCAACLSKPGLK